MSKVSITRSLLDDLAMSISTKSGEPVPMTLTEMKDAVDSISGGSTTIDPLSVTSNGVYTAQSGHAYSPVTVSVPTPSLQSKTYNVSSAGTATVTADSGYDGLSSVAVSVPSAEPSIGVLNGFYTESNVRKWHVKGSVDVDPSQGDVAGFLDVGAYDGEWTSYNAVPSNTTITPTKHLQAVGGYEYIMESAVTVNPIPSQYIIPSGTKSITQNGTGIDVTEYASVNVSVPTPTPTIQSLTVTPSTSQQTFNASGVDGYKPVTVNAMPSGTAGTPTATKGTVSNHSVSVTPSVTNTTGYITGSTKTGTAVTVSASELVSGSETKTQNGTYDVTNLASLVVNVSGGGGTSKNAQTAQSTTRATSTAYTEIVTLTCSKAGTYNVYWSTFRSSTSGTWGSQLYINDTAYGTAQTGSWSYHVQNIHLSNVSIAANQEVSVRVRTRGSNYYGYVGTLTIIEA